MVKEQDSKNKQSQETENVCYCPTLNNELWDENKYDWTGRQFFRVKYKCRLYVPKEDLGSKILEGYKQIARRGYSAIPSSNLLYKTGLFNGELLIEIKKAPIDDEDVKTFQSEVYTKVYIGPIKDLPKVAKTFNFKPSNIYYDYYSCSVCTPDEDEQKTVLIAEKPYY